MPGTALEISASSPALEGLEARIRRLAAGMADTRPLLEALGAGLESQARRRIEGGGPAPDGSPWPEWNPAYADTRHGNQAMLQAGGGLLDSIQSLVGADLVETGSNLAYAALHQFGGTPEMPPGPAAVPARAYLGISDQDGTELDAVLDAHFDAIVAEALA